MQRSHTLPIILTLGAACGPRSPATTDKTSVVTAPTPVVEVVPAITIDAGVPDAAVVEVTLPPLACEPGTNVVAAAAPDPTWFCARADGTKHGPFYSLFPDQQIEIEGAYTDGKLDGPWQRRFASGAIAEQGTYVLGQRDGEWQQLADTGTLIGSYTLKAGTGTLKRWLDDGPLYSEVTLKAGVPHGAMKIYDREGRVVISAKYYAGKLDGDHIIGWKNTLRIEQTFARGTLKGPRKIWQFWNLLIDETYDAKGKLDGAFTIWRDRRSPRVVGTYDHGKKTGTWRWMDKHNKLERQGTFVDGKKSGPWTEYTDSKVTFTGSFTDGKPDGEFVYADAGGTELGRFTITAGTGAMQTFHSNKKLSSSTQLRNGEMHGKHEEYSFRGQTLVEGEYHADKKHGWWHEYTETGELTLEQQWKRGKLDGAVKKYDLGKLVSEATYKDGKADGKYAEYRDGKPSLTGQFLADRRDGTWTSYDPLGAVTLIATYKAGVLDGPWKQLVDGAVVEGMMVAGRRSGTWTRTDKAGQVSTTIVKTP